MPNWCENDLLIHGPQEDRDRFVEQVTVEEDGSTGYSILRSLYPMPRELAETVSPVKVVDTQEEVDKINAEYTAYGQKGMAKAITTEEANRRMELYKCTTWYDWANGYWGTKWGDCSTELAFHGKKSTLFTFDTAWSPPETGLLKISRDFPALRFTLEYFEQGMGFCGKIVFQDGRVLDEEYSNDYEGGRGG